MSSYLKLYVKSAIPISLNPLASDFVPLKHIKPLHGQDLIVRTLICNAPGLNLDPLANVFVNINTSISNPISLTDYHKDNLPAPGRMLNPRAKPFTPKKWLFSANAKGFYQPYTTFCQMLSLMVILKIVEIPISKENCSFENSELNVLNLSTLEINFSSNISIESDASSPPNHANPSTPNMSTISDTEEDWKFSDLNPCAESFTPIKTRYSISHNILNASASAESMVCENVSPHTILNNLRLKNVDKIILGHININSIRNKIHLLADMIKDRVDILLISETKLDSSFPRPQFFIQGYSEPHRLDRTAGGGGLLLYFREDIPTKPLPLISRNIECIFSEITISKKKWLLIGSYNPKKSLIISHLSTLEVSLNHYLPLYDNVIIFGDFNSEIKEDAMDDFCNLYCLKSLIKVPTCFKSTKNPSCIDLILTNRPHNFQNSTALETGLSDFHLLTVS